MNVKPLLITSFLMGCGAEPPKEQNTDLTAAAAKTTTAKTESGTDGRDGVDGKDGRDGIDGVDGKDGKDGRDGKQGAAGVKGENGDKGDGGTDGTDGHDGAKGDQGDAGPQGQQGQQGAQGVVGAQGAAGAIGATGATGASGAAGAAGAAGSTGVKGDTGTSEVHLAVYNDADALLGHLVDFGDSSEWFLYRPASGGLPALRFDIDRNVSSARITAEFTLYFANAGCTGQAYAPASQVDWINVRTNGDSTAAWVLSAKATSQTVTYNSALSTAGTCTNTTVTNTSRWYTATAITLPFSYPVSYPYIGEFVP